MSMVPRKSFVLIVTNGCTPLLWCHKILGNKTVCSVRWYANLNGRHRTTEKESQCLFIVSHNLNRCVTSCTPLLWCHKILGNKTVCSVRWYANLNGRHRTTEKESLCLFIVSH